MKQHFIDLFSIPQLNEWILLWFILAGLVSCVIAGELIRKHFHWPAEVTRKFVHISVGIIIFFAPEIFQSALIPLFLAAAAIIAMTFAVRSGLLTGIHGTSRFSYGTIFYPFSFFVLIVLFWNKHPEIISLSMLSLAIGDSAAAIVGETLRSATIYRLSSDKKSIEGSITMFIATLLSLIAGMFYFGLQVSQTIGSLMMLAVIAATVGTAWEAISSKGSDNFTVPISIAFVLYYFLVPSLMQNMPQFTIGIILSILIAVTSYYSKILNASGSVATFLLASTIYGIGGWKWTVPILVFFVLSSFLSKVGQKKKEQFENIFEKSSTRDWGQVAANGGIAGVIMLVQYFFLDVDLYPIYLGVISAVTADTWGTEIGIWFRGKTVSLSRFKFVDPGSNGGVSLIGFIGSAIGAFIVSLSAVTWVPSQRIILIATLSGILGGIIDSFIGGTIQAQYHCLTCNKITERKEHCGSKTNLFQGVRWINNDVVNYVCAISGGLITWILI